MATRRDTLMSILISIFLSGARCDWVEISQNHYRKEPTRPVTRPFNAEENTTPNVIYRNQTIANKLWKKGVVDRVQNVPNIKRIHVPSVKTTSIRNDETIFNRRSDRYKTHGYVTAQPNVLSKYHEEELPTETGRPYQNNRASLFNNNLTDPSLYKTPNQKMNKIEIETTSKRFVTNEKMENVIENVDDENHTSQTMSNIETLNTTYFENRLASTERPPNIIEEGTVDTFSVEDRKDTVTVTEKLFLKDRKNKPFPSTIFISSQAQTTRENNNNLETSSENYENKQKVGNINDEKEKANTNSAKMSHKIKGTTVNVMWKVIKVVTDAIATNTKRAFKSKINYLEELKTKILSSIEDHVEQTWPEDEARSSRRARDAARGHVEFPSSESALTSISFLTFAVFLIKLVLQLIHTYKSKTMMITPAVVTAVGRAAMNTRTP